MSGWSPEKGPRMEEDTLLHLGFFKTTALLLLVGGNVAMVDVYSQ